MLRRYQPNHINNYTARSHCLMAYQIILLLLAALHSSVQAQEEFKSTVIVDGVRSIANTDENYICATLDWWPHTKCNYEQCPWHYTSIINLNLSKPILAKAIQAFGHLRIRIGGSLQDQVLYHLPGLKEDCHPFVNKKDGLFGFSKGCLHMERWDTVNRFFMKNRVITTFGLNALYGRLKSRDGAWIGPWNSSNTYEFIRYTISKGYEIDSWEFGNELSGAGVAARVDVVQYGKDLIKLKYIIDQLYKKSHFKPALLAPGGFYDEAWFSRLLEVSGPGVINAVTHHIYNLGPGNDPNLPRKIQDPDVLNRMSSTFDSLKQVVAYHGPWSSAWVGESGGAYNSGGHHVSDTFLNSFWYLDQLGMAAVYDTKVYCRQTLIGGNYGLLDRTTYLPNPDYYSALLWNRLMGKRVLSVSRKASPYLRSYAHCSKAKEGITLLFINLSNTTTYTLDVRNRYSPTEDGLNATSGESLLLHRLKKSFLWVGTKTQMNREEYHLTPKDGYLQSQTMLLNGKALEISVQGEIPGLLPISAHINSPICISPSSIAFIVIPGFDAPTCR